MQHHLVTRAVIATALFFAVACAAFAWIVK